MNYLDIIFIIIIVSCTFWGLKKGLIKVIGGIIGIFVGIYFAGLLYPQLSDWLRNGFSRISKDKFIEILNHAKWPLNKQNNLVSCLGITLESHLVNLLTNTFCNAAWVWGQMAGKIGIIMRIIFENWRCFLVFFPVGCFPSK